MSCEYFKDFFFYLNIEFLWSCFLSTICWKTWSKKTWQPCDPGTGSVSSKTTHPSAVLGMWLLLAFPAHRDCSKNTALRWWCYVENPCGAWDWVQWGHLYTILRFGGWVWGSMHFAVAPEKPPLDTPFTIITTATHHHGLAFLFLWSLCLCLRGPISDYTEKASKRVVNLHSLRKQSTFLI